MTFDKVLEALKTGKIVKRKSWKGPCFYSPGTNQLLSHNIICISDLLADDWEVVVETFDFSEALKRMKAGKKIGRKSDPHSGYYLISNNAIFQEDKMGLYRMMFAGESLLANDWYEVE